MINTNLQNLNLDDFRYSVIDGLDAVAHDMETLWGVGRLRLLVSDFLRAKFDAQAHKLNAALEEGKPEFIAVQADGMRRAWAYLDKAAREAGHRPLDPNIWEITLPTAGIAVALVRSVIEAHALSRDRVAFTTEEIGAWLEQCPDALKRVQQKYPGTLLSLSKPKTVDWSKGDPIPF